jgi:hypothetical protein
VDPADGNKIEEFRVGSLGDPELPPAYSDVTDKANKLLSFAGIAASEAEFVIETILNLPDNVSPGDDLERLVADLLKN